MNQKLKVCEVSYSYHSPDGETPALSHISFTVFAGEFLAVVGPSGCGKSTLLSLLCGLIKPEEGSILLDDIPIGEGSENEHTKIGYMLQRDHLFEWRSIYDNTALGLEIQKKLNPQSRQELSHMLHTYGLGGFETARPSELSGGMRQRAALIRTLALKPDLLLLDEPFSALDYQTRLSVCDDISSIIRSTGKTAILITHDLSEAISVADRIIIFSSRPGRIKAILPVDFPPEYNSPLKRRNAREFSLYFNQVWKMLQEDLPSEETDR
ncbi:MAG: ABC transporter ATP-binding protein [Lachnospiraceae bacterium]|nr:ABC transporter ATP-binding protein [Lachnospiraceae bacterium]